MDLERMDSLIRRIQERQREKSRTKQMPGRQRTSGKNRVATALEDLAEDEELEEEEEILGYLTQEELEAGMSFHGRPSRYHVLKAEHERLQKERRERREFRREQRVQFPRADTSDTFDALRVQSDDDVDDIPEEVVLSLTGRRAARLAASDAIAPAYADIPEYPDIGVESEQASSEQSRHAQPHYRSSDGSSSSSSSIRSGNGTGSGSGSGSGHVVVELGAEQTQSHAPWASGTHTGRAAAARDQDEEDGDAHEGSMPAHKGSRTRSAFPHLHSQSLSQSQSQSRQFKRAPYSMMSAVTQGSMSTSSSSDDDEFFDDEGADDKWYGSGAGSAGAKKPLVITTEDEWRVTIPSFLLDYVEELEKQDRDASYYLGSIDSLFMTRGLVRNLSKPTFFPKERLRIFWYQLVGFVAFILYQLAVVLGRVLTYPETNLTWLQYVFYGGISTAVCLPLAGYTYYKTHCYYLKEKRADEEVRQSVGPWVLYALQLYIPLPFGNRRFVYNSRGPQLPWMSFFMVFVWVFMYVITGPFATDSDIPRSSYCDGNAITFGGTMANFFHASWLHLLSNCVILLLFSSVTESAFGGWRTYLAVVVALPLIQPMYGFCLSMGGSAVWGLVAGAFVGYWFATLHWGANFNPWFPTVNFTRAFTLVWILNCLNILGDVQAAVNGTPRISNWVHASAQLMGFLLAMVLSPFFGRRFMNAPGEFNPDVGDPPRDSWWSWWYPIVSVTGLICLVPFIVLGFVWTDKNWIAL